MKITRRHHGSLAEIPVYIGELDHWHLRMKVKLLPHDPLRPATARTQHKNRRDILRSPVFKLAGGVEDHEAGLHGENAMKQ
jgi:hypothetical protein